MLSKDKIISLLNHSVSEKTAVMLHGTSIETAFKFFDTGILPTGMPVKGTRNFLYFAPIGTKLQGTKFYERFKNYTFEYALKEAKFYARFYAEELYIMNTLIAESVEPKYAFKIYLIWQDGYNLRIPKNLEQKVDSLDWDKIRAEARKRFGAVIEIGDSILDLKLGLQPDSARDLRAWCPNGLSVSYINGIKLVGKKDKELLEDYLSKRKN